MGQVYRAHDTKLGRDVALKVLPPLFVSDPDRLARFRREAQVLASLNHPHIGHIYGFEESPSTGSGQAGGTRALVLELVEGPTLADRIARGPIPLAEAMPIARQIADALESRARTRDRSSRSEAREHQGARRRHGESARLRAGEGARARESQRQRRDVADDDVTGDDGDGHDPGHRGVHESRAGKGRAVDRRADIWAFGVVLYEMLTGRPLFTGDSVAETIGFVATRDPDWSKLPPATPPVVRHLLKRCLERDPKARLRDIGEARLHLTEPASAIGVAPMAEPAPPQARSRERLAWAIAAIAVVAAIAIAAIRSRGATAVDAPETRLEIRHATDVRSGLDRGVTRRPQPGLRRADTAADTVVGTGVRDRRGAAHRRHRRGHAALLVAEWALARVLRRRQDQDGGPEWRATDARQRAFATRGSWSADDQIVFAPNANSALFRIPAAGGTAVPVTTLTSGHLNHRFPSFFADGRRFLFYAQGSSTTERGVYIQAMGQTEAIHLTDADAAGVPLGDDVVLFMRQGTIYASVSTRHRPRSSVPRCAWPTTSRLTVRSAPARSRRAAGRSPIGPDRAWARDGSPGSTGRASCSGRSGSRTRAGPRTPELSPDGRTIAIFRTIDGNPDIWLVDVGTGIKSRFTFDGGGDVMPIWSFDGARVLFASNRKGSYNLYMRAVAENAQKCRSSSPTRTRFRCTRRRTADTSSTG
jgi:hypothetical protein